MAFFEEQGVQAPQDGNFDTEIKPLPHNSQVLAYVADVKFDAGNLDYEIERHIKIEWSILKPTDYEGRKIFQKVKIFNDKESTRKTHLRMLAAIDANAGGKIAKSTGPLTVETLQGALMQKPMMLKLALWEMNGKSGNYVSAVSPKGDGVAVSVPDATPKATGSGVVDFGSEDEIPF